MGNVYTVNEILVGALSDRPSPDRNIILYVDSATGKASLADGTTWNDFGGTAIPGTGGDGLTPAGMTIAGKLDVGGNVIAVGSLESDNGGLTTQPGGAIALNRSSDDFEALRIVLTSASSGSEVAMYIMVNGVPSNIWRVNADGSMTLAKGIGTQGHAAQATPRTLAQATITAITDANAKTAVQAVANALADIGALTLT